ncbi:MAG: hypothetical protein OS130_01205 [Thermodesulfobacteriota bacterium]|nr:MAG: hypothetical protein OS130_01205 [Thermodesulfobacteriota bacterium]
MKIGLDDYLLNHTMEEFQRLPRPEVLTLEQKIKSATPQSLDAQHLKVLLQEIAQESSESRKNLLIKSLSKKLKIGIRALQADIRAYSRRGVSSDRKPTACAYFPCLVDIVKNENGQYLFLIKGLELTLATEIEREGEVYVPPEKKHCRFLLGNAEEIKKHYEIDSDHQLYWDVLKRLQEVSVLPDKSYYHLVTVYVFLTYLFEHLSYFPYLWFFGQPERGKSRIAKAVTHLSYRGFYTETLNEAFIFRFAERFKGTLGLDLYEISEKARDRKSYDLFLGRSGKDLSVPRIRPDKEGFPDTDFYDCWGPTVLATNVEIPVHDPLRSRCIKITMPEARAKYPNNNSPEALADLKNRLIGFRARNFDKKIQEIDKPIEGRLGDIMQPLFFVAQLLPPEAKGNLISLIGEFEGERTQSESETLAGRIVQAIYDLEDEVENGKLPFEKVREKVNEDIEERYRFAPQTIGREISSLGINRKKSGGLIFLVWEQSKLSELFKRYLPTENNVPNIPNVPNVELTELPDWDEFFQMSPLSPKMPIIKDEKREAREKTKKISLPVKSMLTRHRVIRDERGEILNPKKNKFSPPEIEEIIE